MWRLRVPISTPVLASSIRDVRRSPRCLSYKTFGFGTSQHRQFSGRCLKAPNWRIQTLAIETSCDDTSVAVLEIFSTENHHQLTTRVLFHDKVTANSAGYGGIHPLVALDSHQNQLGFLVQRAIKCLELHARPNASDRNVQARPDFISVTRGPGMRSNLSVGLNTAKGLALAWDIPLVGVHHMQAHALTPRLCSTIDASRGNGESLRTGDEDRNVTGIPQWNPKDIEPRFPFLSLLVSGGHTMLIDSQSLTEHRILAETQDIAIGDYLDKAARAILPPSELIAPFGKALEDFSFPTRGHYDYSPPKSRQDELERRSTSFGWSMAPPLSESKGGEKSSRRMVYSFSGLLSSTQRLIRLHVPEEGDAIHDPEITTRMSISDRQELAREVQRIAFEHLGSRILLHLEANSKMQTSQPAIETVVVSGGVASNKFLRHVLRSMLDVRGHSSIKLLFPPPELCTDNALMIAWAGMEMYDAGYNSELSIKPVRKWSMDSSAQHGGILGIGGWKKREALREPG